MDQNTRKRPGEAGLKEPDSKRVRQENGTGVKMPTSEEIEAMVQQKKREIAEKLKGHGMNSHARPAAPASAATNVRVSAATIAGENISDLKRRIAETKARVQAERDMLEPNYELKGRGLATDVHPSLMKDQTGALTLKTAPGAHLIPKPSFATVKANLRVAKKQESRFKTPNIEDFSNPLKNPYFDPVVAGKVGPKARAPRKLKFFQKGRFISEANQMRAQAQMEELKKKIAETVKEAGLDQELELVGDKAVKREDIPAAEWWDAQFLVSGTYDDVDRNALKTEGVITLYVQHPVPLQPPGEGSTAPRPLMLTKEERKKLRRQRRLEEQKEKQDKIRLGLLAPDEPKIRLSNMVRVLNNDYIQDPTKIEQQVRAAVEARATAHAAANEARKLTAQQKIAKRKKKYQEDLSLGVSVAVFRIRKLVDGKLKFLIDQNAQQLNLTGMAIVYSNCNIVIVEGGPKGIKKFKRLALNRIRWNGDNDDDDEDDGSTSVSRTAGQEKNECVFVWEGLVKGASFRDFRFKQFTTEGRVRDALAKVGVEHYFEMAKNYQPESAL